MKKSHFLALLAVIFITAFWWAGGSSLVPKFPGAAPVKEITAAVDKTKEGAKEAASWWDRFYRIIALKSAVNAKIDRKNYVPLRDIPLTLQQAIIAVEDNRFYRHYGFDVEGIIRAMLVNLQAGEVVEGGSTITQQLVKNLFLTREQTVGRKAEEFILALDMELRYSKEEILEIYLNTIYFGSNAYGIGQAAKIYFAKKPIDLTLAESSLLAGLPNAPSLFSPYEDFKAAKGRQAVVLQTMVKHGYIGPSMAQEAKTAPIILAR